MSSTWADDEEPQKTEAAAPAVTVSDADSEPPAEAAGAAPAEEYPPGVVPAGQPIPDEAEKDPKSDSVWLKVASPHSGLEIIGAEVTDEYRAFSPQQAALLRDAAVSQGVTLTDKSEEEAGGEASA
jgi:hypothetical protein